jgi:nucleotide sugar dehydrogenase
MTINKDIREELKTGKLKIGVWGLGYIGFSSMAHFARAGITSIGTDIHQVRIDDVNHGRVVMPNFEYWLGFDVKPLAMDRKMTATEKWKDLIKEEVAVHLVTIPTEKDGKPYHEIIKDVVTKLSSYKNLKPKHPPLVIIESTLTPTAADEIVIPLFKKNGLEVGKDILLGVAPRRDWFTDNDKTLKTLPRVVGGTTPETTKLMAEVLGLVCNTIIPAHDHKHASIVKSIENAYRQLDITFANQLSLAYPDMDMASVLKMVGTKWNIGTYHPSFGTGGYCIPLAPQYVLEGAKHPENLTLLKESLKTDFSQPQVIVDSILKRGAKKIAILGIAYTKDLKVHVLSPGVPIARELKNKGCDVLVNDPYYSMEEINKITGCDYLDFPNDLSDRDTIIIVANHMKYTYTNRQDIMKNIDNVTLILDNMGAWNEYKFPEHVKYFEAGNKNWLE